MNRAFQLLIRLKRYVISVLNNDIITTILSVITSQYITTIAYNLNTYADLPVHIIISSLINLFTRLFLDYIRGGNTRRLIYRLVYYILVERDLRREQERLESADINSEEYRVRSERLRDRYREWAQYITNRETVELSPDFIERERELEDTHNRTTEEIRRSMESLPDENQEERSVQDILSQYNTTSINDAIRSAMQSQDRGAIRVLMSSRSL